MKSSSPQRYNDSGQSMHGSCIFSALGSELEEEHDDEIEVEEMEGVEEAQGTPNSWGLITGTSSVQKTGDLLRDA